MNRYAGTATVAAWCEVDTRTVSKWLTRHPDMPRPDVAVGEERPVYGWRYDRKDELVMWARRHVA